MSVSGVSFTEAALQSALKLSGSDNSSGVSNTFGALLSDAMMGGQDSTDSYAETYDLYSELLEQSSGTSGGLLTALMSAGASGISPLALISLGKAFSGEFSSVRTDTTYLAGSQTMTPGTGNVTQSPWLPSDPAIVSDVYNRSAERYTAVINQFNVETNPRYCLEQGGTYCNIFVWDVTSAMGAEIPHYFNAATGEPMERGDAGASQMNANRMYSWLHEHGEEYGWYEVTPEEAQNMANEGHPVVTALYNSSGHGHVQVVCPSKDGEYNAQKGVTVAQAGRRLRNYTYITNIYNASLPKVSYFAHM